MTGRSRSVAYGGPATALLVAGLAVGAAARLWLVVQPPPLNLLWDHHEYVSWSAQAARTGLLSLYEELPPELPIWVSEAGRTARAPESWQVTRVCNYPPLSAYVFCLQGRALIMAQGAPVSNTRAARMIFALPSLLADVLLAAGCWAVVALWAGGLAPAVAAVVVFCAPPLLIDSARWGQTDSWVLAPAVWMLWLMLGRRRLAAGVMWGLALALKTQAVLLAPVWLFAFLAGKDKRRLVGGMALAAVVLLLVSLPFTLSSGTAWFEKSYVENLFQAYKQTTLKAFNIWYLDLLICENDDASVKLLGLEKDTWGKLLLAGGWLLSGWLAARSRRSFGEKMLFFVGASLLCAVMLPTRVHERYIVLPLPFLICAAALHKRLWWGVVPLLAVAGFQISSMEWIKGGAQGWGYLETRTYEQYEQHRRELPPEQFGQLVSPEEMRARQRPAFEQRRRSSGDPPKEWTLTLFELAAAGMCWWLLWSKGRTGRQLPLLKSGDTRQST